MFILLPVRMVFAFIAQAFWFPAFKFGPPLTTFKPSDAQIAEEVEKAQAYLPVIANDGDGPKFLATYHAASRLDPNVPACEHMYDFYHEDITFKRYAELLDNIDTPTPSGDMMAGYLFARSFDTVNGITTQARDYVAIINNIVNYKLPFSVPHPNGELWMRGFIWPVWGDGADVLKTVAMIDSAIETKKLYNDSFSWNLQIIKWLILITNFPLWSWSYDSAVFAGKYHFTKWFNQHSRMMYATAGYQLTNAWYYKLLMKRLYKKYGKIIPEVAYLYKYFVDENADVSHANYLVNDYLVNGKNTAVYTGLTYEYVNIEKLLTYVINKESYKEVLSFQILPARFRKETQIWERNPLKFRAPSAKRSNNLDIILLLILAKKFK